MDFSSCATPPPIATNTLYSTRAHSYSVESMSDDELVSNKHHFHMNKFMSKLRAGNCNAAAADTSPADTLLSDTFEEDEMYSETDCLSSDEPTHHDELPPCAVPLSGQAFSEVLPKPKKKAKPKKKRRASAGMDVVEEEEGHNSAYMQLPINESDDNFEEALHKGSIETATATAMGKAGEEKPNADKATAKHGHGHGRARRKHTKSGSQHKLTLPAAKSTPMHARSFSESNLRPHRSGKGWLSSDDSDAAADDDGAFVGSGDMKQKYMSIKKKYRKQRRISQQFQDAITSIQDDNEEDIVATEQRLREQFEKEYEIRMLELEKQKLGQEMNRDDKLRNVLFQNEELARQNKQLQRQVVDQVGVIQQQQQITLSQQQTFVRMQSGDSVISPVSGMPSPIATFAGQFPNTSSSTHSLLRRVSSESAVTPYGNISIQNATHSNLAFSGGKVRTPSVASQDDNYTLHFHGDSVHSTPSTETETEDMVAATTASMDECGERNSSNGSINSGDSSLKHRAINVEPKNKRGKKKKHKRKKLHDLEAKLLLNDQEVRAKIGDGLSPWDRFLELMTPSFCTCSPSHAQQVPPKKVVSAE